MRIRPRGLRIFEKLSKIFEKMEKITTRPVKSLFYSFAMITLSLSQGFLDSPLNFLSGNTKIAIGLRTRSGLIFELLPKNGFFFENFPNFGTLAPLVASLWYRGPQTNAFRYQHRISYRGSPKFPYVLGLVSRESLTNCRKNWYFLRKFRFLTYLAFAFFCYDMLTSKPMRFWISMLFVIEKGKSFGRP